MCDGVPVAGRDSTNVVLVPQSTHSPAITNVPAKRSITINVTEERDLTL